MKKTKEIYQKFIQRLRKIEKERDEKIKKVAQKIDDRQVNKIMEKIKNI